MVSQANKVEGERRTQAAGVRVLVLSPKRPCSTSVSNNQKSSDSPTGLRGLNGGCHSDE